VTLPVVLTIAGSDSGGGAGIQADLKTFMALACHGTSAITALTAQNTTGVTGISAVPPAFVTQQIDAIADDMRIAAAKTGMLASAPIVAAVAAALERHAIGSVVVDPVFISTSRARLLADDAIESIRSELFPLATVVTPNLYEAGALVGRAIETLDEMKDAAEELARLGPRAVLVNGGHGAGSEAIDVLRVGHEVFEISGPRYDTEHTHGTGCVLSAAIAARLAHGDDVVTAVRAAKAFVTGAIAHGIAVGRGFGPVNPAWELRADDPGR
jgi:hydroxymethylpyrimidine/phosphomethylpyrimidine kinase